MITCQGGKKIPCVMKASMFIRFYENQHGVVLPPEKADQEAAKEGFVLDHSGERKLQPLTARSTKRAA